MFDKDILCGGCPALHAVKDNDISPGLDRQGGIKIRAGATDFNVDWLFPVGDFAQFENLDFKIIRPGPVGMATG